jgi:hypothetical protein
LSQTRDYWVKTERKSSGFAYEHITVTRIPGGNLRYTFESHTKVDLLGVNSEDISLSAVYEVDRDLRPVSFDSSMKSEAKQSHAIGVRAGNGMRVTVQEKDGSTETHEFTLEDAYFRVVAHEVIARRVRERKFRLRLFDATDSKPGENQVEIANTSGGEIAATMKSSTVTTRFAIAPNGQLREMQLVELGMRSYITDASDAQKIDYLKTGDGLDLFVRSEKAFPNVYNVRRATLRVCWKNVPFNEFRFEDNRQKLLRHSESGGRSEAVVKIAKPSEPVSAITATQNEPDSKYFGADEYIQPQDFTIRKQAAAITADIKDPAEKVRRLLTWVNANVKADLIAETLTGPEVLAKKRGKCSEFAILFASLARASGIPTRIALGVEYGSAWVGHMWDEVWLGEWVAVDPTLGTFVGGPSHLKFVDSPTVMGTQRVRFGLVDNLEIEILDFEDQPAPNGLRTGISGTTYVNAGFHCRISAPDDHWTLDESTSGGTSTLTMKLKDGQGDDVEFALVLFALPPGIEASRLVDARRTAAGKLPGYRLMRTGEDEVAGRRAASVVFSHTGAQGKTIVNESMVLADGTSGYLFAWIVGEDKFVEQETVLRKILTSFELVKQ